MKNKPITIREASPDDRDFIIGLAPVLAEVAGLDWHSDETILKFQNDYIASMLDAPEVVRATFVAETAQDVLGFVHVCEHSDEISAEICGTVPLLAVSRQAQGLGVGKALMAEAEKWSIEQGHRLLHLEVFHANQKGHHFYDRIGFKPDTLVMIKPLKR